MSWFVLGSTYRALERAKAVVLEDYVVERQRRRELETRLEGAYRSKFKPDYSYEAHAEAAKALRRAEAAEARVAQLEADNASLKAAVQVLGGAVVRL